MPKLLRLLGGLAIATWLALPGGGAGVSEAWAQPTVSGIRVGQPADNITRFVLDLSEDVKFNLFLLPDPHRVVLDLPQINWSVDPGAGTQARGLITGFRFGQFQPGTARMVLDLGQPAEIVLAQVIPPRDGAGHRLVVDLRGATRERFLEAVQRTKPTALTQVAAAVPPLGTPRPRGDGRKIIMLDPGHGGVDPGAIGVSGIYEKQITLMFAQELRRKLQATGRYRVLMTREGDEFVELRRRVDLAREAQADLFVSIHADSIENRQVRGGTVYTLSQTASDREAEQLAAKENKVDIIAGIDLGRESDQVTSILIDLAQRETMNHSATFAQILVREMEQRVHMHKNGHRFAGFRVLKAPDVPSVLVELGYLSSRADEQMLRSPAGRARLADALLRAVDRYFEGGRNCAAAALSCPP
ncbi:MAG: N-acetylmuramoyl-L-alanine amidase [Alphaproteobacteria bacterium]|nr:N-acetylmuramoyl-L-alanine amidase [Alphaproteobacteria bacterium]